MPIDAQLQTIECEQALIGCDERATNVGGFVWPKFTERNIDMLTLLNEAFEGAEINPALQSTSL